MPMKRSRRHTAASPGSGAFGGVGSPHQLTNCPWCGTKIDPGKHIKVEKYSEGACRTLIYCGAKFGQCKFSMKEAPGEGLPVMVVDEEIYRRLPSLLITTVDKFAQMPWNGAVQMLFGQVDGYCERHGFRSPDELLDKLDRDTPGSVTDIHLICDNVSTHHGKLVCAWLAVHPRFHMNFTPVHCSWMNQVEQWFSIIHRKRLVVANFADLHELEAKILHFIVEWNASAHPFNWTPRSFNKILAKVDAAIAASAALKIAA